MEQNQLKWYFASVYKYQNHESPFRFFTYTFSFSLIFHQVQKI